MYAVFAAARRGAVARGATGADTGSSSSINSSSSLLSATLTGAFFGAGLVLPDALRAAVVFDAAVVGFFPKNSVMVAWAVGAGLVFFTGLIYASSLFSSSSSGLRTRPEFRNATVDIEASDLRLSLARLCSSSLSFTLCRRQPYQLVARILIVAFESSRWNFLFLRQWRRRRSWHHLKVRVRFALLQRRRRRPLLCRWKRLFHLHVRF